MKFLQALATFFVAFTFANQALAQSGQSATSIDGSKTVETPWTARVDGGSMLGGGGGVNFGRAVTRTINAELFYRRTKMKDSENDDDKITGFEAIHIAKSYGLRLDFIPRGVDKTGVYISAAIAHVALKTEVDPILSNDKKTLETDKWGGQGFAGYQIVADQKAFDLAARIGLGAGTGGAYSTTLGGTRNAVEQGLLLDVSVGAMF